MHFYESISGYYDDIFPLDHTQVEFVEASIPGPHDGKAVLDVGCGTGSLALALARDGYRVTGVDLDAAMVELAVQKGRGVSNVHFRQQDMRRLSGAFHRSSLDAILCFGNTLVHLERADVASFCGTGRELLGKDGRLLLQILNYDHILSMRLPGLPAIENDRLRFERIYRYTGTGSIVFRTVLTVKSTGAVLENEVSLYPLKREELEALLKEAGFSHIRFYGNFSRVPFAAGGLPLVVTAGVDG
jgi:2-polyprenyl-3-methyl-5-hydroxy-6-metoxy-1,4-benzoquinol methylase